METLLIWFDNAGWSDTRIVATDTDYTAAKASFDSWVVAMQTESTRVKPSSCSTLACKVLLNNGATNIHTKFI